MTKPRTIVITGGSGLIGTAVGRQFLRDGHYVWVVSRNPTTLTSGLKGVRALQEIDVLPNIVINLTGAGIADKRWSEARKQEIIDSRIHTTDQLVSWIKQLKRPPLLISGSAIGYYGIERSDAAIHENDGGDDSFSSSLCQRWEASALKAQEHVSRLVLLRTGIVLTPHGGALKRMLIPFKLGLGGKIGNGQQWMSWIAIEDLVQLVGFIIDNETITGPINATAPNPVRNDYFSQALANALNRPALFPMPAAMVRTMFGEMGEELLLAGKKVLPKKALESGFRFKVSTLEDYLMQLKVIKCGL